MRNLQEQVKKVVAYQKPSVLWSHFRQPEEARSDPDSAAKAQFSEDEREREEAGSHPDLAVMAQFLEDERLALMMQVC